MQSKKQHWQLRSVRLCRDVTMEAATSIREGPRNSTVYLAPARV